MVGQIQLSIQLEAVVHCVDQEWVAVCPPLDVASQGESQEAALAALTEAVEAWFESCLERNVLDQALIECGFQRSLESTGKKTTQLAVPMAKDHRTIKCSVPAYALEALSGMQNASC